MAQVMNSIKFPSLPPQQSSAEWVYTMRREMQEVLPGLFIGPYSAVGKSQEESLASYGITHIVSIREPGNNSYIRQHFPKQIQYLVLEISDKVTENIIQYIPQVKAFIDDCLGNGGRVVVHGLNGISRSAALVIAYIMEKYGLQYKDAFLHVQAKRFCVCPNEGFVRQLMEYEAIYLARMDIMRMNPSLVNTSTSMKRKHDEAGLA